VPLENDYLKAVIPPQARVLGQRLKPLSLGHMMVLSRYGSPFVTGDRQPQFGDLCFAVWVCQKDWRQLMEGIANMDLKGDFRFLKIMGWFKNQGKSMVTFAEYLTQSVKEPTLFFNKVEGGKPTSMNNLHYLKIVLMQKLNKTAEQAMNTPFGEAVYDLAAVGESEGVCGFVTEDHEAAGEAAKRQWEKRQEKQKTDGQRN
tara:strand:- start:990 stop:1592 length:603 start_codon:yes stop_codon:yes gene_type:complete